MAEEGYDSLARLLQEIAGRFGSTAFTDRRRLLSLLSDRLTDARREIRVVSAAIDEGVFTSLVAAPGDQVGMEIDRLAGRLESNLGIRPDIALPIVRACAYALGRGPLPSVYGPNGTLPVGPPPPAVDDWIGVSQVVQRPGSQPVSAPVPPPATRGGLGTGAWLAIGGGGGLAVLGLTAFFLLSGHEEPRPAPPPAPPPQQDTQRQTPPTPPPQQDTQRQTPPPPPPQQDTQRQTPPTPPPQQDTQRQTPPTPPPQQESRRPTPPPQDLPPRADQTQRPPPVQADRTDTQARPNKPPPRDPAPQQPQTQQPPNLAGKPPPADPPRQSTQAPPQQPQQAPRSDATPQLPNLPAAQVQAGYAEEFSDFGVPAQDSLQRNVGAPTPTSIPGAQLVGTGAIVNAIRNNTRFVLIDSLADPHTQTLPRAQHLPYAGSGGSFNDSTQQRLVQELQRLTQGQRDTNLVFFCQGVRCWESYNAALRALNAGYTNVYWYRGGIASWQAANLPLQALPGR